MCSERCLRLLLTVGVAGGFCLAGCSIKEDRADCPCQLTLLLPGGAQAEVRSSAGALAGWLPRSDTLVTVPVPRTGVWVSAVRGASWRDGLQIPLGEDCPPLWMDGRWVDTRTDADTVSLSLHKAYGRFDLVFAVPDPGGPLLSVRIAGETDGYDARGRPTAGPFACSGTPDEAGVWSVSLPRQRGGPLWMHLVFADQVVRTFAFDACLSAAGYDWLAPDLEDRTLQVNVSLTALSWAVDPPVETETDVLI